MIPDNLKKKCFWEYNINVPLEKIPGTIKAQRFADFWPYFHEAFKQKELNSIQFTTKVDSEQIIDFYDQSNKEIQKMLLQDFDPLL